MDSLCACMLQQVFAVTRGGNVGAGFGSELRCEVTLGTNTVHLVAVTRSCSSTRHSRMKMVHSHIWLMSWMHRGDFFFFPDMRQGFHSTLDIFGDLLCLTVGGETEMCECPTYYRHRWSSFMWCRQGVNNEDRKCKNILLLYFDIFLCKTIRILKDCTHTKSLSASYFLFCHWTGLPH